MANDKSFLDRASEQAASTPKKAKKPRRFTLKNIAKYFREMRSELKKVVWPTPRQTANNTAVALVVIAIFAVVIWGFDTIASLGVQTLIRFVG